MIQFFQVMTEPWDPWMSHFPPDRQPKNIKQHQISDFIGATLMTHSGQHVLADPWSLTFPKLFVQRIATTLLLCILLLCRVRDVGADRPEFCVKSALLIWWLKPCCDFYFLSL